MIEQEAEQAGAQDFDVAIIGGGPVGLAVAYLLGRQGVSTLLVEKRGSTATLPKGQKVHSSTRELFRQWGVTKEIGDGAWPFDGQNGHSIYTTLKNGHLFYQKSWDSLEEYNAYWDRISPEGVRYIPAYVYEKALHARAKIWETNDIRFATEAVSLTQGSDGVELVIRDVVTGNDTQVTAQYVVAADGRSSWVRQTLGDERISWQSPAKSVHVEFTGPLETYLANDDSYRIYTIHPDHYGWFARKDPSNGFWRYGFSAADDSQLEHEYVARRVVGAIGDPKFPVDIKKVTTFNTGYALNRRWRNGRVFYVGDAARHFSAWGGFGMNLGIREANNLAWKLAYVLRQKADPNLLETYEAEQRPLATGIIKHSQYTSQQLSALFKSIELFEDDNIRNGSLSYVSQSILDTFVGQTQLGGLHNTGYELGAVHRSTAVVSDPATAPTPGTEHFEPKVITGGRAPHAWLRKHDQPRLSITDLFQTRFSVVTDGKSTFWATAASEAVQSLGVEVVAISVGEGGDYEDVQHQFAEFYALRTGDAVLVRPDGYIAARLNAANAAQAKHVLIEALHTVLGISTITKGIARAS